MNLYRVTIGGDQVYWTADDALTAKVMVQLWAWRSTGRWMQADKVEVVQ